MGFLEELSWRGMLQDQTPGAADRLNEGMQTAYIGFDPTAPSMTLGNYVQIMILTHWQQYGHRPILLLGGATGRIGDPSGKDKERQLKSYEELDKNLNHQREQASKFLNFGSGANQAIMVNNYDFYKDMNVLSFLRDVGKNLTVNYMIAKDSVKNRLASGLSFTEFSYQLLQAYDYLCLYRQYDCRFQMGGSDQWGNIMSGTEFIRRNIEGGKAHAITTPLLTKSDGKKFGKSEEGNVWLDPELTSPYQFYQFWINAADGDIPQFAKYFSLKSKDDVLHMESQLASDPQGVKRSLAQEITIRVHSEADYQRVLDVSEMLFNRKASRDKLVSLPADTLVAIKREIPSYDCAQAELQSGLTIVDLLSGPTSICKSKGEARRAVTSNAVSINKSKITDPNHVIDATELIAGRFLLVENGKKNKYVIEAV